MVDQALEDLTSRAEALHSEVLKKFKLLGSGDQRKVGILSSTAMRAATGDAEQCDPRIQQIHDEFATVDLDSNEPPGRASLLAVTMDCAFESIFMAQVCALSNIRKVIPGMVRDEATGTPGEARPLEESAALQKSYITKAEGILREAFGHIGIPEEERENVLTACCTVIENRTYSFEERLHALNNMPPEELGSGKG